MKRLLWVGDAACPSGFARATHEILDIVRSQYDVTVLGLNYHGDPHPYPYKIFSCTPGGDYFGVGRLIWMCDLVKPDVIIIQNDGWNIQSYVQQLRKFKEYDHVPVIAVVAVDGKNFRGGWLKGVAHAIFWTRFALDEARSGGYIGPATVIPLGVDQNVYKPLPDKAAARIQRGLPPQAADMFVIGSVNRNQPRKRWDLLLQYFAEWLHGDKPVGLRRDDESMKVKDALLFLHVAPTGDMGIDVKQLAAYYKILSRIALVEPPVFYGVSEEEMALTYNCFSIAVSTTQGEGFGLTTLEAMACGVPCLLPDWSAHADWAKGAAWMVPCTSTAIGPPFVNVIGGVVDREKFIAGLDALYRFPQYRETNSAAALERASQARFRWPNIGQEYLRVLDEVLTPKEEECVAQ